MQTLLGGTAASHARAGSTLQAVVLWRVWRVVLGGMHPLEPTAAWNVRLARVTVTSTRRHHVRGVQVVGMRVSGLQTVHCVQLARLTWTLMPRPCALYAHLVTIVLLVRHHALLVRLVSMTTIRMRAQHVYHVL